MQAWVREYLPFALAIFCLFAARSSIADHYVVPSGSMEHTLLPGDRVVANKQAYGFRIPFTLWKVTAGTRPDRGDVVIFDSPVDGARLIKRAVALAGDVVEIRGGHVLVNGTSFLGDADGRVERFGRRMAALNLHFGGGPDFAPVRVPSGHVFVLGDARGNSRDSRFFGFVPEHDIYAQAVAVFFRSDDGFVWMPL